MFNFTATAKDFNKIVSQTDTLSASTSETFKLHLITEGIRLCLLGHYDEQDFQKAVEKSKEHMLKIAKGYSGPLRGLLGCSVNAITRKCFDHDFGAFDRVKMYKELTQALFDFLESKIKTLSQFEFLDDKDIAKETGMDKKQRDELNFAFTYDFFINIFNVLHGVNRFHTISEDHQFVLEG